MAGDAAAEPLLLPAAPVPGCPAASSLQQQRVARAAFVRTVAALAKVIIGAGMMAIPAAFRQIGWAAGGGMLAATALLTFGTLATLLEGSARTRAPTYSALARACCGPRVARTLALAILLFSFGFIAAYLVIIRDVLVGTGTGACDGLLCEVLGLDPASALASPRLVVVAVSALVCAPLLLLRSLDSLSWLNAAGIACITFLACTAAALGLSALAQGRAHAIPLAPQWTQLGPTAPQQLAALAAVLPVVVSCYVAHQSLHPLRPLLQPYSDARMRRAVAAALAIAFACFSTLAVGSALAFGPALNADVLNNYSTASLARLVPVPLAKGLSWSIRAGFAVSLLASLLLYMPPLRLSLAELLWPDSGPGQQQQQQRQQQQAPYAALPASDEEAPSSQSAAQQAGEGTALLAEQQQQQQQLGSSRAQRAEQRHYFALSYCLLAAVTLTAQAVPNIWEILSAVGDLTTTIQAFIVPGLIGLALERMARGSRAGGDGSSSGGHGSWRQCGGVAVSWTVVALGLALFAAGVAKRL